MTRALYASLTAAFISTAAFTAPASAFDLASLFGGNNTRIDDCRSGSNFSRCGSGQNHGAPASTVSTAPKSSPPSTPPSNPPGCGDKGDHNNDGHGHGDKGHGDKGHDGRGNDHSGHDGKGDHGGHSGK